MALRCYRLPHNVFVDTLIVGTSSNHWNKSAEIFATNFGWMRVFLMKSKSVSHETLQLMFQIDGVPPQIIVDGSKEQVESDFHAIVRNLGVA